MRFPKHQVGNRQLMDLVPVVNVVLLLTFFFLLSWSFVLQPGIEVRPPVTDLPAATQRGRYVITLKATKDDILIFFDEKSVESIESLKAYLKNAAAKTPGARITIYADASVPSGQLLQVQALTLAQDFHVTMATQRPATSTLDKTSL